jgi:hypothetical protein
MFGKNNAGVSDHLDEQRFETWFKKWIAILNSDKTHICLRNTLIYMISQSSKRPFLLFKDQSFIWFGDDGRNGELFKKSEFALFRWFSKED